MIYIKEPRISVICKTPTQTVSKRYVRAYDVRCGCESGTVWDDQCQDCVPVCFDQLLGLLKEINRNLPAKIIG